MKHTILTLTFFTAALATFAQSASDALRYSYLQPSGSARYVGAGGAFGALGADFGALSQNPAGTAMFRSSELVLTPALRFTNTEARLAGSPSIDDDKSNFGFDNVGLVFHTTPSGPRWKTFNFAIGLNSQNNYNQSVFYQGSANGSIMNGFFADAQSTLNGGGSLDDLYAFGSGLAYDANAIYYQNGVLTSDFEAMPNAVVERSHTLVTSGKMNEMAFSFGGNYDEVLMVGATIGVPFVNYRIEGEYIESDPGEAVEYFDQLTYTEFLRTEGVGVNLKMGMIYKPMQALRLGLAFHTPTALRLTDTYNNSFTYDYTDGNGSYSGETQTSPDGVTDYRLRTPWRASASAAVVVKKFGFLSADVEVVDYSANRFNMTADVSSQENELFERALNSDLQRDYKQTMNVRLGGEAALDKFRLRAGLNLLGKPQEGESGFNTAYTAGLGVRGESFYFDLGYRRSTGDGSVRPYADAPVASTSRVSNDVVVTLGFKF
jgi:hypothetical protein